VVAWSVAQWDYILPQTLTVSAAAAPSGTIKAVLAVAILALIFIVPSFTILYLLDQKACCKRKGCRISVVS
jgi:cytochrome bd ubiquinol oxidase subunit II